MNIIFEISSYLMLLITLITMIFAFTWKARKGKWLLCVSLILSFFAAFHFRVLNLLIRGGGLDFSGALFQCFNFMGIILHQAANILLLCFVIVARKPSPSMPPLPIVSDFDKPAGDIHWAILNDFCKLTRALVDNWYYLRTMKSYWSCLFEIHCPERYRIFYERLKCRTGSGSSCFVSRCLSPPP